MDRNGIPLALRLPSANAHDATQLLSLVDAIPPIIGPRGRPGQPRKRTDKLHADKAYDSSDLRCALRARSIAPRIARRGIDSSERLGRHRWVVERSLSWLLGCRRLGVRYERRAGLLQGLLHLACALICLRFLGARELLWHPTLDGCMEMGAWRWCTATPLNQPHLVIGRLRHHDVRDARLLTASAFPTPEARPPSAPPPRRRSERP